MGWRGNHGTIATNLTMRLLFWRTKGKNNDVFWIICGQVVNTKSPAINLLPCFLHDAIWLSPSMSAIRVISHLNRSSLEKCTTSFFFLRFSSLHPTSIYTSPLSQSACGMRVTCDFGLRTRRGEERAWHSITFTEEILLRGDRSIVHGVVTLGKMVACSPWKRNSFVYLLIRKSIYE
jgi:hypothetical protein